ncbi:MAG: Uma2 family endonuclease [Leptolyngbyaceae cyanobacterium bins.302]|nr:Uma2 family endonuclease [Leptolyngbyaceae cyanobacterium bins.302]
MVPAVVPSALPEIRSLEDWMQNPPEGKEWVNGELVEKHPAIAVGGQLVEANGMTLKHSRTQARLASAWKDHKNDSESGGEVYTEAPCRTNIRGRYPDVAYLTPELVTQYGDLATLPQSFPLSAEIVSSTDFAEEVIAKAQEYLESGGAEVWLIFPENRWIIVVTQETREIFVSGQVVSTQKVLSGFRVAVDELLG